MVLKPYLESLRVVYGLTPKLEGLVAKDSSGSTSRAWRIILNNKTKGKMGAIFDWDDTLEPYTIRKERFYRECIVLLPERVERDNFVRACRAINKTARVLPVNGVHPEHYSPLLELMAITTLINPTNPEAVGFIKSQTAELSPEEAETLAREYLKNQLIDKMPEKIKIEKQGSDGKQKEYFFEITNQSTAIDFRHKPGGIDQQVWDLYKKCMTESNIPKSELDHFNLPEEFIFIVATFGEAGFQLEKIVNSLRVLSNHHVRLPDEILLFTRGRKNPILEKLIEKLSGIKFCYIDDSPRQLDGVSKSTIVPVHARRAGARRSSEAVPEGMIEVNMEESSLHQIVERIFSS
jgi:hypothetical protein